MTDEKRARQIAQVILDSLEPITVIQDPSRGYKVTKRGGCAACDPGTCPECGYLFTGEIFQIEHRSRGKRNVSDRAVHYLSHGMSCYQTGYVIRGEPVTVELNLEELASYLDLT
jgi:hypothetical protein